MRDKELSKRVGKLEKFIVKHIGWDGHITDCFFDGHLYERIKSLENRNLKVRYCKKCKHDTLQESRSEYHIIWAGCFLGTRQYCLACGTLWRCEEKTVCKEVKKT